MQLQFANGTVLEHPEADDLLDALEVASVEAEHFVALNRPDGQRVVLSVSSGLEMHLIWEDVARGYRMYCLEVPVDLTRAAEIMEAFRAGQEGWTDLTEWSMDPPAGLPSDGPEDPVQTYRRTRAFELLVAGVFAAGVWMLVSAPRDAGALLTGAGCVMAAVLGHVVNWRCPTCGRGLKLLPRGRCSACGEVLRED